MSGDPMKLIKFTCVAKAHADGRSDSALTIHDGVWAFCPGGAEKLGHEWKPSDGLPLTDAMRFTPRQPAPLSAPAAPVAATSPLPKAGAPARGKTRPR